MILVDTSVWIDFFRGTATPEVNHLSKSLKNDEDVCLCGVILTEILQGIKSELQYQSVKADLENLIFLPISKKAYYLAADLYRHARAKGETIRNTMDCLIAACAIVHRVPLLQSDKDYRVIAGVSKLKLVLTTED